MRVSGDLQLTYCTNIHPANGWPDVFANLRQYAPALKQRLSPGGAFGLGLRLSDDEAGELLTGPRLSEFKAWLRDHGLYVALLNGFPYGAFHGTPVKSNVFAPDWREQKRLRYTLRLIDILRLLTPDGMDGGVSTPPFSYKPWIGADPEACQSITRNVATAVAALVRARGESGTTIHIDVEPEPNGLVEDASEFVAFFRDWIVGRGAALVARDLGIGVSLAEEHIRNHLRLCLDTCHMAVEYEEPETVLPMLHAAGISVGRVQVSSALRASIPESARDREALIAELQRFADTVYLHQVVEKRSDGTLRRYRDLDAALAVLPDTDGVEWRIHYHVPLFTDRYRTFVSTQGEVRRVLRLARERGFTRHLEIETYTWSVLPADLQDHLLASLEREYRWVLDELCANRQSSTSLA
jgi:hypothetical protein